MTFATNSTAAWLTGHESNPRFCLLSQLSRERLDHVCLQQFLAHTQELCGHLLYVQVLPKSSLTTASTFHTRGLIRQQSPKCYLIGLSGQFCKLVPCFHLCDLWRDDLNMHCLQPEKSQPKFPHICIKKTTQKFVFSPVHCH